MARLSSYDIEGKTRDWREVIPQQPGAGFVVDSKVARRRALKKWTQRIGALLFLGAVAWLIWLGWKKIEEGENAASVVDSAAGVHFESSQKCLTKEWFLEYSGMSRGVAPNIFELRKKMLKEVAQIEDVSIERLANGDLSVKATERNPVARIEGRLKSGEVVTRIVSDDGVVYRGINYSAPVFARLPVLTDFQAQNKGDYDYIPGMKTVGDLIKRAYNYPLIFQSWSSISVKDFRDGEEDFPSAVIRIRIDKGSQRPGAPWIRDVIFSAKPERYTKEFATYVRPDFLPAVRDRLSREPNPSPYGYDLDFSMTNKENPNRPVSQYRLRPVPSPEEEERLSRPGARY